ncbi:MAG: hypothetical protein AAAB35_00420 [Phyllobacterium sp.]|uniref:hypothetical protein n=1 Tax=Phyllobacterium sp. TaxID=1871046 RepID=UPI0030F1EF50
MVAAILGTRTWYRPQIAYQIQFAAHHAGDLSDTLPSNQAQAQNASGAFPHVGFD